MFRLQTVRRVNLIVSLHHSRTTFANMTSNKYVTATSRNPGTTTVKEAFDKLLQVYKLRGRFNETYLEAYWGRMMGNAIASRTTRLYVREGTLYIELSSAPLRSELVNAKQKVIQLVNKEVGSEVISDVVFI